MGVMDILLRRKSKEKDSAELTGVAQAIMAGESNRNLADREFEENLGINAQMIEDRNLGAILSHMACVERHDGDNKIYDFDLNALSMVMAMSRLIRTARVDPIDCEIGMLQARCFARRIEMGLPEVTYELGGTNFLDAFTQILIANWACAKDGWYAKLMKVTPRSYDIRMGTVTKEKGGTPLP